MRAESRETATEAKRDGAKPERIQVDGDVSPECSARELGEREPSAEREQGVAGKTSDRAVEINDEARDGRRLLRPGWAGAAEES